jgi:REP element-mobilizing transposase RayT
VDRRFVFGDAEREHFRMCMRMQENFSGCRVLSYCVMSNHFHILLEVPPMPEDGISDELLLKRLLAIQTEAFVAGVAKELDEARMAGREDGVAEIHARFTYRMHNLSEFMKTMLQRFTRWFNRTHERSGTLWEERYKSVIVESGIAARTMAAYIDLNPVRAGMVADPAAYRWSSYGEAVGGGTKGNDNGTVLPDLGMAAMLRCRVRYFTDGAVIGSKAFVNEAFAGARERFTAKRKDGARRMRGSGAAAAGVLWSMRDLRVRV